MATIWNAPFTISTVRLPLPPVITTAGLEDEWGIPITPLDNGFMLVELKLRPTKKLTKEAELSLALQKATVFFEGFVVSKTPDGELIPGTKGTGVVNGQQGEIKVIATGQSSLGIVKNLLGEKVSIEFMRTLANI
jgi:hypothetical protein